MSDSTLSEEPMQTTPTKKSRSMFHTALLVIGALLLVSFVIYIILRFTSGTNVSQTEDLRVATLQTTNQATIGGALTVGGVATVSEGVLTNDISGGGAPIVVHDDLVISSGLVLEVSQQPAAEFDIVGGSVIRCTNQSANITVQATLPSAGDNPGKVLIVVNATSSGSGVIELLTQTGETINYSTPPYNVENYALLVSDGTSDWKALNA